MNAEGRLLHIDEPAMMDCFRTRPGSHPSVGEHAGKYLEAAALSWAFTGNDDVRALMDHFAQSLIDAQLPDGYLGTYSDDQRWTSWDVWVHKYNLAGLLSYYSVTGSQPALETCRRVGDLVVRTFGDSPGQRDILQQAGAHMGMAATSVLEPMCRLYRFTGEQRYLDFARYLVRSYDRPQGPRIITSLIQSGSVRQTANAKAYELMSNLIGLIELYRLTGERAFLEPALIAWRDIASRRLYLTGTTSSGEYFRDDFDLPGEEASNVGQGCATVAWLQLNWHLLRVTGEARYADQIERTVYNQLLAAQDPRNGRLCPFTPLNGRKRPALGANDCVSSQPRGLALIPASVWGSREGGIAVMLYVSGEATIPLRADYAVTIKSETTFPAAGAVTLSVRPPKPARFPLFLRVPAWARSFKASVNRGEELSGAAGDFLRIDRMWKWGDTVRIEMDLSPRLVPGGHSYPDHVALERGPQVLALEAALNPAVPYMHRAAPRTMNPAQITLADATAALPAGWGGTQAYAIDGLASGKPQTLVLVPFADAVNYRVWLPRPDRVTVGQVAVSAFGRESWSRTGSVLGSICDERGDTYRTTFEGAPAREDWYAVEMDEPADIARVVYRHGKVFENGGWFDTSAGKPSIQVRRSRNGPWETVATLETYPAFTSAGIPGLRDGDPYAVRLKQPVHALAVRIVGRPARAFSSCAELAAYVQ